MPPGAGAINGSPYIPLALAGPCTRLPPRRVRDRGADFVLLGARRYAIASSPKSLTQLRPSTSAGCGRRVAVFVLSWRMRPRTAAQTATRPALRAAVKSRGSCEVRIELSS